MNKARMLLFPLILLMVVHPIKTAAQNCSSVNWQETRTRSFAFIFESGDVVGEEVLTAYGDILDAEFNRFAKLFQTSLPLPITIRIYPTEADYYCLNILAQDIPIGSTHSHVGAREIALISENITKDPQNWEIEGLNALRHELAILFVNQVSGDKAPPGLLIGIGVYAEDPALSFENRLEATGTQREEPRGTWRSLWENPDAIRSQDRELQNASIIAYLVDVYGWAKFLSFLQNIPTSESYRQALVDSYGIEPGALQEQWREYYPAYFGGRWRANVLHAFDLSPFEQLIAAGAYSDAANGLKEAIEFLVDLEDIEKLVEAEVLNERAQAGLAADALTRQSRQALLEGDYEATVGFATQARKDYNRLGDQRRFDELDAYQSLAQEVLDLRTELDEIKPQTGFINEIVQTERLIAIGQRLTELGDEEGFEIVQGILGTWNTQRQRRATTIALGGTLLGLGLLIHRIYLSRREPPSEVMLQF